MTRIMEALQARAERIKKGDKGFTLIELLVVVIIIGILAAIAIPVYIGVQNSSKESAVQSDLGNAKTAVVSYYTNNNGKYPTIDATLASDGYPGPSAPYTTVASDAPKYLGTKPADNAASFCLVAKAPTGVYFTVSESGGVKKGTTTAPTACL